MSNRGIGEQALYLDLAVKGCTAEVHFRPVVKADWACGKYPQDCHGFPVECSLGCPAGSWRALHLLFFWGNIKIGRCYND